jgi:hypothetical protein
MNPSTSLSTCTCYQTAESLSESLRHNDFRNLRDSVFSVLNYASSTQCSNERCIQSYVNLLKQAVESYKLLLNSRPASGEVIQIGTFEISLHLDTSSRKDILAGDLDLLTQATRALSQLVERNGVNDGNILSYLRRTCSEFQHLT